MRISFLGPFGFHPNKTMRSRAMPLARELVRRGHRVQIAMPPWQTPAEAGRRWQEDGVDIIYVNLAGAVPATTRRLIRASGRFQPDVVHAFKPKAYSGLAQWWLWYRRALRRPGRARSPLLITDTDDWEGRGGWNEIAPYSPLQKRFFAWQELWGLAHCDRLTVASLALVDLAEQHGVPQEKIAYLPNGPGIPVDPLQAAAIADRREALGLAGRPTVLLYSRLFEFDTSRLVSILKIVHQAVPDLAVLAIGTGLFDEDNRALRQALAAAGLLDAVVDLGWLDEAALPLHLSLADLGLYLMDDTLLNRTKCPVKLAEMVGLGLPVVGEAVGQVPEYVAGGRTGLVVPSGDTAAAAAAVVDLLADPQRRREMGAAARRHAREQFHWPILAGALEDLYQDGLSEFPDMSVAR